MTRNREHVVLVTRIRPSVVTTIIPDQAQRDLVEFAACRMHLPVEVGADIASFIEDAVEFQRRLVVSNLVD